MVKVVRNYRSRSVGAGASPAKDSSTGRGVRLPSALYTILYNETAIPAKAAYRAKRKINNLRRCNTGHGTEPRPAHHQTRNLIILPIFKLQSSPASDDERVRRI